MSRIPAFDPFSHIKFPRIFLSNFDGYVLIQILKMFETNFILIFVSLRSYSVHRVSQEERLIFWEVRAEVILSKNVYMNMCPIPNVFRDRAI